MYVCEHVCVCVYVCMCVMYEVIMCVHWLCVLLFYYNHVCVGETLFSCHILELSILPHAVEY